MPPVTGDEPQVTLRDTLESAFEEHVEGIPPTDTADGGVDTSVDTPTPSDAVTGDDRPRDASGKFIKREDATSSGVDAAARETASAKPGESASPSDVPASHGLARPSSWKKDYEDKWGKLDADLAKYILDRESQYAKGVSTYKQEYDQARPIVEAMQPFMPLLQHHNIAPNQWITNLGNAHQALALGTPEQKLGMFLKMAQDYNVPLQALFQQGQDGQVYFNPQVRPYQPQPAQQTQQQPNVDELIDQRLMQREAVQALARFEEEAPQKYQHYEEVKETMARLLEAGLAKDYPDAYNRALRQPEHEDFWNAMQEQQRKASEAEATRRKAEEAARARRQAVSVRSATPASAQSGKGEKRDLRSQLESAFEEHAGAGRV